MTETHWPGQIIDLMPPETAKARLKEAVQIIEEGQTFAIQARNMLTGAYLVRLKYFCLGFFLAAFAAAVLRAIA